MNVLVARLFTTRVDFQLDFGSRLLMLLFVATTFRKYWHFTDSHGC